MGNPHGSLGHRSLPTESSTLLLNSNFSSKSQFEWTSVNQRDSGIFNRFRKQFGSSCFILSGLAIGVTVVALVLVSLTHTTPEPQVLKSTNTLTASLNDSSSDDLVVQTPLGSVKGHLLTSREGRDYYGFYKIPYAKPPIGNLRFKSPQPAEAWEGIRDEAVVAPQCIQRAKYSRVKEAVGEEDCLFLNLYKPNIPKADEQRDFLMPTLFYIHGGGFTDGNGSRYGAKYFMDEDVVLITFQYRLGPFGFLSTNDGEITGNMAFKDQVMALKWVQDNVRYFGGDPNRVMIFGNSAGAFSVSHLMISPMANGLFHTAITQSGGSFCETLFGPNKIIQLAEVTLKSLAEEVGCSSRNQRMLLRCLRRIEARDLAIAMTPNITYNLVIEKYETDDSSDVFMPEALHSMIESGKVNKVPWIVGVNSAEFVHSALDYLTDTDFINSLNENFSTTAPDMLNIDGPKAESISLKIKDFYFGDKMIGNDTERNLTNLISDRSVVHCSKAQATMQAEYSEVYLYYLSKEAGKSYSDKSKVGFPLGNYGTSHADELQFLFNYNSYPEYPVNSTYFPFSRMLIKIWTQFAATGKPYSENGIEWRTLKSKETPSIWFELNDNPRPTTVLQSRMDFWDQFSHEDINLR